MPGPYRYVKEGADLLRVERRADGVPLGVIERDAWGEGWCIPGTPQPVFDTRDAAAEALEEDYGKRDEG